MALAALAACTKSEVQYEPSGEISFAPVAKTLTKSVAGYDYGASDTHHTDGKDGQFDGVFPTGVNLYVFANASNDAVTAWEDPYFKNALFVHSKTKGSQDTQTFDEESYATTGAYAGQPTRYWPNVKTLKFAGYSNACGISATNDNVTMDFTNNVLTIQSYTQDNKTNTAEGTNDLMYFLCDGNPYSKQATEIAAQMKHACSWITINVAVADGLENNGYKLNCLELAKFYHTGKVVCSTSAVTWTDLTNDKTETYYGPDANGDLNSTHQPFENVSNNFIVIPQTPVNLNVTYTYVSQDNESGADLTLTETAPVSLALADGTAWQAGTHYIYNVTITATEILIDPVVVDWTNYAGNNIGKEVK